MSKKVRTINDMDSLDNYDFIDLGGGDGASMKNIQKRIGGTGAAIEIDKKKVEKAAEDGVDNVYLGSALGLHKIGGKTRFITCDNFLEHLPGKDAVKDMIKQSIKVATDFIFIRHPSFEELDYLNSLGVKPYWSHWRGHTAMLTIADFMEIFFELGIDSFKIVPVFKIKDIDSEMLLPLSAPIDQHYYDKKLHGAKPKNIKFDRDLYYSFDIIALVPGTKAKLPILQYHDRLNRTNHPNFVLDNSYVEIKRLRQEIERLNRKPAVRIENRARKAAKKVLKR